MAARMKPPPPPVKIKITTTLPIKSVARPQNTSQHQHCQPLCGTTKVRPAAAVSPVHLIIVHGFFPDGPSQLAHTLAYVPLVQAEVVAGRPDVIRGNHGAPPMPFSHLPDGRNDGRMDGQTDRRTPIQPNRRALVMTRRDKPPKATTTYVHT